jgi:hypothetical protein
VVYPISSKASIMMSQYCNDKSRHCDKGAVRQWFSHYNSRNTRTIVVSTQYTALYTKPYLTSLSVFRNLNRGWYVSEEEGNQWNIYTFSSLWFATASCNISTRKFSMIVDLWQNVRYDILGGVIDVIICSLKWRTDSLLEAILLKVFINQTPFCNELSNKMFEIMTRC